MERLGGALRRGREAQGRSLEDVADATKIGLRYLQALERDDYPHLPYEVFTRGFIKVYARYLGLDEQAFIRQFELEGGAYYRTAPARAGASSSAQRDRPTTHGGGTPGQRGTPIPWRRWAVGLGLVGILVWALSRLPARHTEAVDVVLGPRPVPASALTPAADAGHEPAETPVVLSFMARELTWIEVQIDGAEVREALLQPGDRVTYEAHEGFLLTLGNAGGVDLFLNGEPLGPLGRRGEVVRDVRLPKL